MKKVRMDILIALVFLIVGFILLIKGADWFVDGAAGIAASPDFDGVKNAVYT